MWDMQPDRGQELIFLMHLKAERDDIDMQDLVIDPSQSVEFCPWNEDGTTCFTVAWVPGTKGTKGLPWCLGSNRLLLGCDETHL